MHGWHARRGLPLTWCMLVPFPSLLLLFFSTKRYRARTVEEAAELEKRWTELGSWRRSAFGSARDSAGSTRPCWVLHRKKLDIEARSLLLFLFLSLQVWHCHLCCMCPTAQCHVMQQPAAINNERRSGERSCPAWDVAASVPAAAADTPPSPNSHQEDGSPAIIIIISSRIFYSSVSSAKASHSSGSSPQSSKRKTTRLLWFQRQDLSKIDASHPSNSARESNKSTRETNETARALSSSLIPYPPSTTYFFILWLGWIWIQDTPHYAIRNASCIIHRIQTVLYPDGYYWYRPLLASIASIFATKRPHICIMCVRT